MQIQEVCEVVQVVGATNANKRLAEGWKLLSVNSADGPDEKTMIWYVLGRPSNDSSSESLTASPKPDPDFSNWP
jgi:hypothetical protein